MFRFVARILGVHVRAPAWLDAEIRSLLARYHQTHVEQATVDAWWSVLRDYPQAAIVRAIKQAPSEVKDPRYPPSAELVRRIADATAKALRKPQTDDSYLLPSGTVAEVELDKESPFATLAAEWSSDAEGKQLDADTNARRAKALFTLLAETI